MLSILLNGGSLQSIFITIVTMLGAMTIALTVHEYAHALAAYINGDITAKFAGRLSLNPFKHLDILGTLSLLLVGFGWAKPVPINPNNFKKYKKGVISVSLAGVLANLITAILNFLLLLVMLLIVKAVGGINSENIFTVVIFNIFFDFFMYGILINLTLMAFNILPICPLDGFHVVEILTKPNNSYCRFMYRYGNYLLFGLLIGGMIISNIGSMIGGALGNILSYFDIIGTYINAVQTGFLRLFGLIFGVVI